MRSRTQPRRRRSRELRQRCDEQLRRAERVHRSMRTVRPVPTRRLQRGAIVWAHVPFADTDGWKLRPGLVTGADRRMVRLHPISSALSRLGRPGYLEIVDLDAAGLDRPSGVNLLREVELPHIEVILLAGALSAADGIRFEVHTALLPVLALPDLGPVRSVAGGFLTGRAAASELPCGGPTVMAEHRRGVAVMPPPPRTTRTGPRAAGGADAR